MALKHALNLCKFEKKKIFFLDFNDSKFEMELNLNNTYLIVAVM